MTSAFTHISGGKLTVPSIPRQQPSHLMDEDGRWQLLKRA